MTGPTSAGPERGTGAPSRSTGTQGAVGAVLFVLALGLALRVIIAQRIPGSGFGVDLQAFQYWASDLASNGPWGFYDRPFFHDYTPGYLYVLWIVGIVGKVLGGGIGDLIKVPPILADLAIGWLVYSMVLELGGRYRLALIAAFVAVINPISWFDSVVWGQVDSFGVVFLLLGLRDLWRDKPERSAIWTVIAAIIKPQLGILVPLVAVVTIRRALWPAGGQGENEERTGRPVRILTTALAGFLTAVVVSAPFGLTPVGLVQQILVAGGGYPYLSVNAYNIWAVVPSDTGISLASAGLWVCDAIGSATECGSGVAVFGVIPAIAIGIALLLGAIVTTLWLVARRPDRLALIVGLAVLALAFFMLPTRVHERYGYPFFALAVILAAISWRWRIAYLLLSAATFANMYVVLTTLYPDNPKIHDWLGIGSLIRSPGGVVVVVVVNTIGFVWVFLQLRARALAGLEGELEAAGEGWWDDDEAVVATDRTFAPAPWPATDRLPPQSGRSVLSGASIQAGALTPAVTMPTWTARASMSELGVVDWIRDRWSDRAVRPDRSAKLAGERGGRLDRLDLWILVVLVVASLTLRIFRLEEPYQMHFDEVYHARTATEFLQDWRYGQSHDIYEWTHPHLAKYAMALGIMAWGQDAVSATSDLGVPVVGSAIEPRRDDSAAPGGRAGERLHVATGSELRTYDLRTRDLISTIAVPGISAVTFDETGAQLLLGFADGRVETLKVGTITSGGTSSAHPTSLGSVKAPVQRLFVDPDGTTVAVGEKDHLDLLDLSTGAAVGGIDLPGLVDIADGGTGSAVVATIADVTDAPAEAAVLSNLLGGTVAEYQRKLTASGPTVNLGLPGTAETRTSVETAISDGKLAGISIDDIKRIATATSAGVTFVDAASASIVDTVTLTGGAHGLGIVIGLDDPKLYVTAGTAAKPEYHVIAIGGDPAAVGPTDLGSHPMPGLGSSVVFDRASQMIHILGRAQGASASGPWTVYVIEPHANAVYADAKLPAGFVPATWVADLEPQYPTDDRQQILVMDVSGATASIPTGSHAFSWRLPGVIAGTLMLVCLYLLTRILFRRRLVAGLVGLFVLIDGMMFVQSRIGMNDVYVGLFIVAAYALFAAVYTGWWRGRAAFWLAFPIIGLLLGLALASKWVALYAIGGVALLMLVRSALGRVVAILALIAITSVLGYMGITVPAGAGAGNVLFLLIMVALCLVAVVAAILHPIAWTDEEMRFALILPVGVGAILFFGALALGKIDQVMAIGPASVTPLLASVALALSSLLVYAAFWVGGRIGFGPLAGRPAAGSPAELLDPPAPAPEGWLRMGWLAGLPVVWAAISLLVIPIVVYVVSYLPWAAVENHQILAGFPSGHTGQTLVDLTKAMYGYHNGLVAAHPADSPWWAWLFDLKPVWFYQGGFAGGTSGAIYDAGNLVLWWMGVPAMLFVAVMAFRRRSPALALIAVGFACQWISWARIDRAAFQYHYYTSLPFVLMALAYFMAELWHGASRHAWQLARLAGAIAVVLPAALWLFSRPLCAAVDVAAVNKDSAACPAVIPDFVLTTQTAALALAIGIGLFFIVRTMLAMTADKGDVPGSGSYRSLAIIGVAVGVAVVVASRLPDAAILTLQRVPVEPIVLVASLPLIYLALTVLGARDPRRFVVGFVTAAIAWFVILYPNISALPLPSQLVNAYQGILPTYLYAFQFPVSQIDRNASIALFTPMLGIIAAAVVVTCAVVGYSAWVWRLSAADAKSGQSDEPDPFARTGGA